MPPRILFGRSAAMVLLRQKLDRVAHADVPVLLEGESGTGKELIASYLHEQSLGQSGLCFRLNCAGLSAAALGASGGDTAGAAVSAPGTLFLDEVGELDGFAQMQLLRMLGDGQTVAAGGGGIPPCELRVVSATSRDLAAAVEHGAFRRDLFYRLNVLSVRVPPLRERLEDLPALADYLIACHARRFGHAVPPLSGRALRLLERHDWPGNIRELENFVKRYVIFESEDLVLQELQAAQRTSARAESYRLDGSASLKELTSRALRQLEGRIILQALEANDWNRKRAAKALRISYRALLYKIKDAGLPSKHSQPVTRAAEWAGAMELE
ncbi:MAG TPA: sigma 54-interacting transcriptional regulator [Terriglobales bacterium]|nr:sigma 54-interacting transcriptional regulator [Terriglobales bacterium]